jgi:alkylhydroperoxidase/carboxymuconolactone decarboxylase family protein YurZ
MAEEYLPPIIRAVAAEHPGLWEAYNRLGEEAAKAGPITTEVERLVKLAVAVGAGLEGAVHSHVRRGLVAGLTREQLRHVAFLAITTIGWPSAVAALSWIDDALEKDT